jgi:hypothetical protein
VIAIVRSLGAHQLLGDQMTEWVYEIRTIRPTWETQSAARPPDPIEIIEAYLNGMGEQGWELAGFLPSARAEESAGNPVNPLIFHAVFKRPKLR